MSKQAYKRLRRELSLEVNREKLPKFAWPGGYPLYYIFTDGGFICPDCVNKNISEIDDANRGERRFNSHGGWAVDGVEVNYEDNALRCDHCGERIESAYSED
jgi:hypothetical protein